MKEVYIISAKRTPIGSFLGKLSKYSATQLGAIAIKEAYSAVGINVNEINAVYMGNVLSSNLGQAPARQAAKYALIPDEVDSTTINKVCSSGLKAIVLAAQQIQLGLEHLVIAGGMESMSNAPHYLELRHSKKMRNSSVIDGLLRDGLIDAYNGAHMGNAAELCAKKYKLTREEQDAFALRSYEKANIAFKMGKFKNEIVPVTLIEKNEEIIFHEDEDVAKVIPEKVPKLKPAFVQDGTITAANASSLNDGAGAILLASKEMVEKYQLKPLAKIIAYADAAQAPEWFTTSPAVAITKALSRANLPIHKIDHFEINEAYAAVTLANQKILNLAPAKINSYGGAVAIGHPLGASGARILCTLISVLNNEGGKYGIAAICNGGGGATAIVIENVKTV